MSWTNNSKQARFEASQNKKSVAAGLKREIKMDELVETSLFSGTFEKYIETQRFAHVSFSEAVYSTGKAWADSKKTAYIEILKGHLKLTSGEEIRKYVQKQFANQ